MQLRGKQPQIRQIFSLFTGYRFLTRESIHEVIGSCTQGWSVGWSSGVNFHCMQISLVMRRWFISSGDFDGAPFWSRFGFVTLHAQPCACHQNFPIKTCQSRKTLSNFITHLKMTNYLKTVTQKQTIQRYPKRSYLNFPVTYSICFSFVLSCSAAVELPSDTETSPTSALLLGVIFKNQFFFL